MTGERESEKNAEQKRLQWRDRGRQTANESERVCVCVCLLIAVVIVAVGRVVKGGGGMANC